MAATAREIEGQARAVIGLERVRLESALLAIAKADGFANAIKAVETAIRSVAAELREEGFDLGDFLG